jgi:5-formyltetrahydrofolate cyclo-ligase
VGDADLVLAPGLAVDGRGTRLGQGGGCYDRALPRRRAGVPVLVLLHPGEREADDVLPREAHDVPVDGVVTADGIHWPDPA